MQIIRHAEGLRRLHRRLRRRRRHGREGADRGRRRRRACSKPGRCGTPPRTARCSRGPTTRRRRGAAATRSRSASSTAASAAGRSRASRTRVGRGALALVPRPHARRPHESLGPHLAALRARTTSARKSIDGLGDDWPITYDDIKPYYDKLDRSSASSAPTTRRTGCTTSRTASSCRRRSRARYELLIKKACRQAEDPVRPVAAVDPHEAATTAAPRATTAASAAAAARRTRTSRRRRCCCRRRSKTGKLTHRHQRDGARGD